MTYLLFFLYAAIIFWLLSRIPFFKNCGIATKWLLLLFGIRAVAGMLNCYLSYHYFPVSDSLALHTIGLNEYYLLTNVPKVFFLDLVRDPFNNHYTGLFEVSQSFWNNLRMNVIVKGIAMSDVITLRNFYTNTLFYNFIVFFGSVALYKVFSVQYDGNKLILIIMVFLFPSSLYYTSAIHKDGLIMLFVGIIIYTMHRMLEYGFTMKRLLILILFFLLIFSLRNFVSMIIAPALVAWWLAHKRPQFSKVIFLIVLLVCVVLFFYSRIFVPGLDFPRFVAERRESFDVISKVSNTYMPLGVLTPTLPGFINDLPISFYHAFCLPALWNFPNPLSLPFVFELMIVWALFILFLIYRKSNSRLQLLLYFMLFFCLVNLLMIGYTIPNLGAILRYRSIYIQLLAVSLFVSTDWRKMNSRTISG